MNLRQGIHPFSKGGEGARHDDDLRTRSPIGRLFRLNILFLSVTYPEIPVRAISFREYVGVSLTRPSRVEMSGSLFSPQLPGKFRLPRIFWRGLT